MHCSGVKPEVHARTTRTAQVDILQWCTRVMSTELQAVGTKSFHYMARGGSNWSSMFGSPSSLSKCFQQCLKSTTIAARRECFTHDGISEQTNSSKAGREAAIQQVPSTLGSRMLDWPMGQPPELGPHHPRETQTHGTTTLARMLLAELRAPDPCTRRRLQHRSAAISSQQRGRSKNPGIMNEFGLGLYVVELVLLGGDGLLLHY